MSGWRNGSGCYLSAKTIVLYQKPFSSPLLSLLNAAREEAALLNTNVYREKPKSTFPRFNSVLNCLSANQMGSLESMNYQHEISALKLRSLHYSYQFIYPNANTNLKIRLLRGGIKHMYGQWESQMRSTVFHAIDDFIESGEDPQYDAYRYEITYLGPQYTAVDMCEGFSQPLCMLYVCNDFKTRLGSALLAWRQGINSEAPYGSECFYVNSAIWCCCSNRFTGLFALGIENGIYIHNSDNYLYTKQFDGEVLGVHFNKTGDIIYAGINQGKLITVDTRVVDPVCATKLNDHALTEVTLLDNENYMLCAGLGNFLCQVDLRMQRKVVNYIGDCRNTLKNPFSFSEAYDVLCSTGSDNVTRTWSLRGGKSVKTVFPPIRGEECRSLLRCYRCATAFIDDIFLACVSFLWFHHDDIPQRVPHAVQLINGYNFYVEWPPRSPYLTLLDVLWDYIKDRCMNRNR